MFVKKWFLEYQKVIKTHLCTYLQDSSDSSDSCDSSNSSDSSDSSDSNKRENNSVFFSSFFSPLNCDKTQKLKLWQNLKTQNVSKLKMWQN